MKPGNPDMRPCARLVVVTVNWRRPDLTIRCLDSIAAGSLRPAAVVVVDNGSGDGSAERIRAAHPAALVVELPDNSGFTGGFNTGIRKAIEIGADLVLLLNNDAEAEEDTLAAAMAAAESKPDADLMGIAQRTPDGKTIGPFFFFRWSDGRVSFHPAWRTAGGGARFLSGCAVLARRRALEKAGLFDERFHLYCEDIEFSLRAAATGLKMAEVPGAAVRHELFASSGIMSPVFLYYNSRNLFLLRAHAPAWRRAFLYPAGVCLRLIRKARKLARSGERQAARSVLDGVWAGLTARRFGCERIAAPAWLAVTLLAGCPGRTGSPDNAPASAAGEDGPRLTGGQMAAFAAVLALGIASRLAGSFMFGSSGSSDHGVAALMARHVALGREWPVFYYGQPYMGSVEMILGGLAARLFGINTFTVNLGTALFGILLLPVVFDWARRASDFRGGLAAMLFCAIGGQYFFQFMSWAFGAYAVNTFLTSALVWLAVRLAVTKRGTEGRRLNADWLILGAGAGVGWWSNQLVIPAIMTAGLLLMRRKRASFRGIVLAGFGFLLGSAPFWAWNAVNNWETFRRLSRGNGIAPAAANAAAFASRHLPDALGIPRGPGTGVLLAAFVAWFVWRASREKRRDEAAHAWRTAAPLLVIVSLPVFSLSCPPGLATPRYMLALVPAFAVMGGVLVSGLLKRAPALGWAPVAAAVAAYSAVLPACASRVGRIYRESGKSAAEVTEFLLQRKIGVAAAPYLKIHAFNWLAEEKVIFAGGRDRYLPYARMLEETPRLAVVEDPAFFAAFLRQSCGRYRKDDVGTLVVRSEFQPPRGGLREVPVESVSAAASVRSEPVVALTDEDAGTSWVCADEATLTVTLPEEADVAAIRLFSKDNAYPAVAEVFFQRSGTNWVGGGGAVDAKWFWSGPRPYFGEWMRRLEWRLAPCRTRMFRVRFTAHRKRPCVITELQVFEPADAEDPAGGAEEVLGFLDSVGADNVYCDRWLVNTLSSVSGGRITTPRRPDIYGGSITARDVSLKVGWTEGTAFVTSGRDAALCRRALENAGVSMTEAQAGGWTVFHFGSGDYSPLYRFGAPLEWVGYGCLGLEVGCETRVEFFCARAAELVRAGRRVEGLRLAERSLAEGPPSRSGMEALAAAFESAGMPAEAGAWRQSASSAWTPGLETAVDFRNGVRLEGITAGRRDAAAGTVEMTYFWRIAPSPRPPAGLVAFVHFLEGGRIVFQDDHDLCDGRSAPEALRPDRLFAERRSVRVPEGGGAGYGMRIGLLADGRRVKPATALPVHNRAVALPLVIRPER